MLLLTRHTCCLERIMTQNWVCLYVPEIFMESYCRFLEMVSFLCVLAFFPTQSPCLQRHSTPVHWRWAEDAGFWSSKVPLVFQNKNKNKAQLNYRFLFHPNHQSLQGLRWKFQVWLPCGVNQNSVYGPYIAWLIPVHTARANQIKCNVFPYIREQRKLDKSWCYLV